MRLILFILFYFLEIAYCIAQDFVVMRTKILDRNSNEPLPYANIGISNSSRGTVSSESGEFEFHIPENLKDDSLKVSYLGYKSFKKRISDLKETQIIYLEESPTLLSEITVSDDGARKLVEEALKSIPKIYPTTPYLMEGFHRSWEKVDYTDSISYPGTLIEAAVTIYDPGYAQKRVSSKTKEAIYLDQVRRSEIREGWDYGRTNMLRTQLDRNSVRYNREPSFIFLKNFLDFPNSLVYEWEGSTRIDNETVSIVKIEVPNTRKIPATYRVYISDADHAILRFDLSGSKKEIDYSVGEWQTESLQSTYIFKRYQMKVYLSYTKIRYTLKKLDIKNKKILQTEDYFRELLINNLITDDVDALRKSLAQKKSKEFSFALQAKGYHEDFWKNYNVLQENPLDKEIVEYFDKKHAGSNPFKAAGKRKIKR